MEKAQCQEYIYFCFIDYTKAFDCVDHNKLWKILKEMEIPNHFTYLLSNLYTECMSHINTYYDLPVGREWPIYII